MSAVLSEPLVVTTGMTLASPVAMDGAILSTICESVGTRTRADGIWPADDEILGALAFGGDGELTLTFVRRSDATVFGERPDVAAMLGAPVADAVRIDVMLREGESEWLVRAEIAMVALAAALGRRFGAIACDDLGFVYDPAEIARLDARGEPRALAFSYALAATRREVNALPLDILPPALPETMRRVAPVDPFPDYADDACVAFAIPGPHVPLVLLARITLALAGDERTNPEGRRVVASAPNLAAAEALRLAAFGVDLTGLPAAGDVAPLTAETPVRPLRLGTRDELDVFARELSSEAAIALVRELVRDLGLGVVTDVAGERGFPQLIASFDLERAGLDVYHLSLAEADDVFRSFVGKRADLRLLLSGDVGACIAIESYEIAGGDAADGDVAAGLCDADVLGTLIASAFVERTDGVAGDAAGAVYGDAELARLAMRRLGRADSWSGRLTATTGG